MYILLLPVGQTGQAWETSEKLCSYVNWVASDGELVSVGVERVDCLIGNGNWFQLKLRGLIV